MENTISTKKVAELIGFEGDMSGFRRKLIGMGISSKLGKNKAGKPMRLWDKEQVLAKFGDAIRPESPKHSVAKSNGEQVNVTKLRIAEPMVDLPRFARMCGVTNINLRVLEKYGIHPVASRVAGENRIVSMYLKSDVDRYNTEISRAAKRAMKESEVSVPNKQSKSELHAMIKRMNDRLDIIEKSISNALP